MGDDLSRVVGAGQTLTINGKDYKLKPICMRLLMEIQQECVRDYKREYLRTFTDNADILGDQGLAMLSSQTMEVAGWTIDNLPQKWGYDTSPLPVTKQLRGRVAEEMGQDPKDDKRIRAFVSAMLEMGTITSEEVAKLAGKSPRKVRVPYDAWWSTGTYTGMSWLVWSSISQSDQSVTREEVLNWPIASLIEAARIVESLTSPAVGNT